MMWSQHSPVVAWFIPSVPLRRLAIVRAIVYGFLIVDCLVIIPNLWALASHPELFAPVVMAQILHLPPVGGYGVAVMCALVIAGSGTVVWTSLTRCSTPTLQVVGGLTASIAFTLWAVYTMSYGYVQHDHMALVVATWVLPTAPFATVHSPGWDERAGWALRAIQCAVIATYFFSVLAKWMYSGTPIRWANSAIFAWAFIRRGSPAVTWMLDVPWLFIPAQWALLALETLSPIVLFLRGKILWSVAAVFALFHAATFVALGIHFLPTVVCWAAFLPFAAAPTTAVRGRALHAPTPA